jgi:integrase
MTVEKGTTGSVQLAAAAELLEEKLGLSLADLLAAAKNARAVPTFSEYAPVVAARTSPGSLPTWSIYWRILVEEWGERRIDEPTLAELRALAEQVKERGRQRKGRRNGHGAMANFIDATNNLYNHAVDDKYVTVSDNPAARLKKPPQQRNPRHALSATQMDQLNDSAATVGPDPELDTLVLRLHTETACRRGGALALRRCDLNEASCTVRLREKGDRTRDQPVSPTLMAALVAHSDKRNPGGAEDDPLLRELDGRALRVTYYGYLWIRLARRAPWVATLGVTVHWIRYTTLTWVERNFGYAIAAAFAGHASRGTRRGATHTYVEATLEEVATALAALTGEAHPLAANAQVPRAVEISQPQEFRLGPESETNGMPLGVLEAVVQRRADKAGVISIAGRSYTLGSWVKHMTIDIQVYTGRYLVQLPDGRVRILPRPVDGRQVKHARPGGWLDGEGKKMYP